MVVTREAPRRHMDNAFIEAFDGRLLDECLNQHRFLILSDARMTIDRGA